MKKVAISLAALGFLVSYALPAMATTPVTFAQFTDGSQGTFLANAFDGMGNWTGATLTGNYSSLAQNIQFNFNDLSGTPATLQPTPFDKPITAFLTYSAQTLPLMGMNTPYASGGANPTEPFTNVSLHIVAATTQTINGITVPAGANLLTMTSGLMADPNDIGGILTVNGANSGGTSGTFSGTTTTMGFLNKVQYTSAYLDFSMSSQEGYALSYTALNPSASLVFGAFPAEWIGDFGAETTGTFNAALPVSTVPEPSSLALLVSLGVGGSSLIARRRR